MKKTFVQQFSSWAGGFIFLTIVNFALGGIIYFLLQGLSVPVSNVGGEIGVNEFYYIFGGNILEALTALICLQIFMQYHTRIRRIWLGYAVLILVVYVVCTFVKNALFSHPFTLLGYLRDIFYLHYLEILFDSNILIATLLLYEIYLREEKRLKRIAEQEFAMVEMRELRTKAELEALQAKISPHFL
ncbi:MAG: hypothetical protein H7Y04_14825, partial [Verrucomicrobia bacterium]|nr:hypothetical protein [Cytophagales bacterium]